MIDVEGSLDLACLDVYDLAVVLTNYAQQIFLHLDVLDAVYGVFEDLFDPDKAFAFFILCESLLEVGETALSAVLVQAILKLFSLVSEDID